MGNVLQPVLDWAAALPAVAQMSLIAITVSLIPIGISIASLRVSRQQAQTSQQNLFVGLVEKRIKWLEDFRTAVRERLDEIHGISAEHPFGVVAHDEQPALFKVGDGRRYARWLFDDTVAEVAEDMSELLDDMTKAIIVARAKLGDESMSAAKVAQDKAWAIETKFDELVAAVRPFLYVGDVKRPGKVLKVRPAR